MTKAFNILIIATDFKPQAGGVAEYAHQLAEHLQKLGNDVIVLSESKEGDKLFDQKVSYKVVRKNFSYILTLSATQRIKSFFFMINDIVKNYKINCIILNQIFCLPFYSSIVSFFYSMPLYIIYHGSELTKGEAISKKTRLKHRIGIMRASKIIANSNFTKELLIKKGVKKEKITVINPAIPESFLYEKSNLESLKSQLNLKNEKIILSLARNDIQKGIPQVLKALPNVIKEENNLKYIIAGTGDADEVVKKLIKELYLENYVIFLNRTISENEKMPLIDISDIVVLPAKDEGFGIIYLEANARGKPVIGANSGGAREAILNNYSGLLVEPDDVNSLAKAIIQLLKNKELALKLGEQGKLRVEKQFLWKQRAELFYQMIKEDLKN